MSIAAEQGIDADEFRNAYNSFFVNMRVRRAEEMGQRFGIDGVPAIIVNGKYRVSASLAGGYDEMVEVAKVLAARENKATMASN